MKLFFTSLCVATAFVFVFSGMGVSESTLPGRAVGLDTADTLTGGSLIGACGVVAEDATCGSSSGCQGIVMGIQAKDDETGDDVLSGTKCWFVNSCYLKKRKKDCNLTEVPMF